MGHNPSVERPSHFLPSLVDRDSRTDRSPDLASPTTACFISSLLGGAAASVEMEIYSSTACRRVAARDGVLHLLDALAEGGNGWTDMCRSDPAVQRETTRIITSILLVAGALSALTAAWWGALADRKGRKVVLFASTVAELFEAGIMVLVLSFPQRFGYGALLLLAAFAGLSGGQLANMAVASAYLGDIAGAASKAQLLSSYEAALFAGLGLGPLLGSALMRYTALGPRAPYILMLVFNAAYLLSFAFMPESLPPSRRARTAAPPSQPVSLVHRTLAVPAKFVAPFKVLIPRKVDGGKRRDGRLLLVAISGALLLVDTGPVEVLYARAKYSWGPQETGRWLSYTCAAKLVVLLGIMPLVRRWFKPVASGPASPTTGAASRDVEGDAQRASTGGLKLAVETRKRKSFVEVRYDVRLARCTMSLAVLGYLVMLLPSPSVRNFLLTSATVSIAAAAPPALQSLALSLAGPEDAAKVLACVSALATVSTATLGPSVFGTAYVASVEWWPEMIFGLAALWMAAAVVPLLFLRFGSARADEEEQAVGEEARA
ncbi:hypothetical protein JCM9279_006775 [Rhodotorula babjevae]